MVKLCLVAEAVDDLECRGGYVGEEGRSISLGKIALKPGAEVWCEGCLYSDFGAQGVQMAMPSRFLAS